MAENQVFMAISYRVRKLPGNRFMRHNTSQYTEHLHFWPLGPSAGRLAHVSQTRRCPTRNAAWRPRATRRRRPTTDLRGRTVAAALRSGSTSSGANQARRGGAGRVDKDGAEAGRAGEPSVLGGTALAAPDSVSARPASVQRPQPRRFPGRVRTGHARSRARRGHRPFGLTGCHERASRYGLLPC